MIAKVFRQPRIKLPKHLAFIRQLRCVNCLDNTSTEAAHIRSADWSIGKPLTGNSIKPDDFYVVPLCSKCHRLQHEVGEMIFWDSCNDPIKIALALYAVSGDIDRADRIIDAQMP